MKNLQNNTLRNDWPMVAVTNKNVYLCPKKNKKMNDEALPNENKEELRPYTMEEINAMIDQAEQEFASGLGQDSEDIFRELEEEGKMLKPYTREELLEMAETGRKQIAQGYFFSTEEVLQNCGYEIPKGEGTAFSEKMLTFAKAKPVSWRHTFSESRFIVYPVKSSTKCPFRSPRWWKATSRANRLEGFASNAATSKCCWSLIKR